MATQQDTAVLKAAAKKHAQSQVEAIEAGVTITGIRLVRNDRPDEGVVVTLTANEAKSVVAAVLAVVKAKA